MGRLWDETPDRPQLTAWRYLVTLGALSSPARLRCPVITECSEWRNDTVSAVYLVLRYQTAQTKIGEVASHLTVQLQEEGVSRGPRSEAEPESSLG